MEYYNNILCATQSDLQGLIAYNTLKLLIHRGKAERVRRACLETPALYSVESLPYKYKVEVYRRNPDLKAQTEAKPLLDAVEADGTAIQFFEQYTLPDGRHLPNYKQWEYSNNAAILNCCKNILERCQSQRCKHGKHIKKGEFWAKVAKALPRLSDKWPNTLPENPARLQEKFRQYISGGYETLINGRFMNKHAAVIDTETKEDVLLRLIADRRNLNDAQISELFNCIASKMEWKPICAATVSRYREKFDLESAAGRHGMIAFNSGKSMTVKRSRPTAPLLFWTADGWDAELLYQQVVTDKAGHSVTTYNNRLTMVVVLDTCINYPIGYAIGEHENPALIKEALRNAVNHTAELFGHRYRTNQFQSDHYAMKTMKPLYDAIGDKVTPARVHNAKAKVIEPYFGDINTRYCQFMPNWSGFGITSNKKKQPNTEALNDLRHNFPDREGCASQLVFIIESERKRLHDQYVAMFANLSDEYKLELSDEQYLLNFGCETGYKNTIEASGLRPTIEGVKKDYECFDIKFRQLSHIKWIVKYDPADTKQVLAVSEDGSHRFMLEEKYVQPMALAERKDGDAEQLARVAQFNKKLETHITDRLSKAWKTTDRLMAEHANELDPLLSRMLICDSNGQHKDRKNAKRGNEVIDLNKILPNPAPESKLQKSDEDSNLFDLY
ncbi:MAG: hypothetical protein MJ003_04890 [Paludibacteraceae bacterium]|nr:hypothetical protein [Paludibacteraceae bacterium]